MHVRSMRRGAAVFALALAALATTATTAYSQDEGQQGEQEEGRALSDAAIEAEALGVFTQSDGTNAVRMPQGSRKHVKFPPGEEDAIEVASRFTKQRLDGLTRAISLRNWHANASRHAYGIVYDASADAVLVETDAPGDVQESLRRKHGSDVRVSSTPGIGRRAGGRNWDSNPHYGGAYIYNGDSSFASSCTAGVAIRIGTAVRQTTANHCFRETVEWYGDDLSSGPYGYGIVATTNAPSYPTFEFKTIAPYTGNSFAGRIWVGNTSSTTSRRVAAASAPCLNCSPYYYSGAVSGEIGKMQVLNMNATYCDSDGCTYNLVYTSGIQAQDGDSGAPFYAKLSNGDVSIRGLLVASGGGNYFENWQTIANYYGATIVTG
jgi:hypothetical protein